MSARAAAADLRPSNHGLYAAAAVCLALAIGAQVIRDRGWQPYQPDNSLLWIRSGPLASRLALGFDNLVADVYWMRAVIYYGSKRRVEGRQLNFDSLAPLLDLVTALDPHFRAAYRFGAIFLTEAYPAGPGRPDLAVALLQRAIDRDYGRWEYYQDIGFVHYWWIKDFGKAAEWFSRGADRPGAPEWLRPLAATTLARGGDRRSSRFLWRQLLNSDVEYIRTSAQHRLAQLDAMDVIDQLVAVVSRFQSRTGRWPQSWQELQAAERLRGIPPDPTGVPFELDPSSGRVDVSRSSTLWPLPADPGAPARP